MLVTFFAIATALAIIIRRRLLDRVILVLSAVPIALIANVARLTLTGILKVAVGIAPEAFHNSVWAAIVMIVLALGLLWIEIWMLSRLLLEPELTPFSKSFLEKRPTQGSGTAAKLA
jgi:exosortase/archaeosortase family protein